MQARTPLIAMDFPAGLFYTYMPLSCSTVSKVQPSGKELLQSLKRLVKAFGVSTSWLPSFLDKVRRAEA